MSRPEPRPIQRLLIANRGEIAQRIISAARELDIETYAIYSGEDVSHTNGAAYTLKLSSPASFMNISELMLLAKSNKIDAVHPGYGFLSESADFSRRMWEEAGITVVGPGWETLSRTGDKLQAKALAQECSVPTLPALTSPTNDVGQLRQFAQKAGYPIMIKAIDGGGGRGIRLVRSEDQLESNARRAIEESPSRQVFAEKAAVDGYRHVEVQIVGDGEGGVYHLWERECSIQRRYQKVVEIAPSTMGDRKLAAEVINAAIRMAKKVNYFSLGTFEFLANSKTSSFYFLEINPRLQVEHTITESLTSVDIVRTQLLLSQGEPLSSSLSFLSQDPATPPSLHSIQLRITAENVHSDWTLSIGKLTSFSFPSGNGIRIDTNLVSGTPSIITADFDSLIAKVIVTASSWPAAVSKASRALQDTKVVGVKTNLDVLRGIVAHPDFLHGRCDTTWLETHQTALLHHGESLSSELPKSILPTTTSSSTSAAAIASSNSVPIFRKGDAWSLTLSSPDAKKSAKASSKQQEAPGHLQITKLLRNEFPASLAADILFTPPPSISSQPQPTPYILTLASTSASAASLTSTHRRGDPKNERHVIIPFPGKLVDVLVDVGDFVSKGMTVAVVQQMKMELEVRSSGSGTVGWVTEAEDGEEVGEGVLVCELEGEKEMAPKL
ncbi:hypothetical protein K402DRAFT_363820 [Aulographum hederae CBS 113979]|uniref:Uncharacterized protein n=1 Tax=Aulographum hederae CBS 113979 TaxID=1176131 RepID=A0A6G1GMQ1_9PEZI|nr:hypothetical protein K402DRAFT_363820 [Aulographum hederae CBS 113979]